MEGFALRYYLLRRTAADVFELAEKRRCVVKVLVLLVLISIDLETQPQE